MSQGINKGMDRPAIFEVSHHIDVQTFQTALRLLYGVKVKQGLAGMLVSSIAGVHDRHRRHRGGNVGRPRHRMPHDNHVHIVGDYPDGVLEGLPFRLAGVTVVRETYYSGPKPIDRGLKREPSPGRRLKEKAGDHFAGKEGTLTVFLEFTGHVQDVKDLLLRQVLD